MGTKQDLEESARKQLVKLGRLDEKLARGIERAYRSAMKELVAELVLEFGKLPEDATPAQVRRMLSKARLIGLFETRLAELVREWEGLITETVDEMTRDTWQRVRNELGMVARVASVTGVGVLAINELSVAVAEVVLADLVTTTEAIRVTLVGGLRVGLARGDRYNEISKRLFGVAGGDSGVFPRGLRSAKLMGHRAVSEADGLARQLMLEKSAEFLPDLQKKAIAKIDKRTSKTCKAVNDDVVGVNEPFKLRGGFGEAMTTPFHWGP